MLCHAVLQVDLWLGDALNKLPEVSAAKGRSIDLLLLDGVPKETLQYLKAAEPYLSPGAMIIADNAGGVGFGVQGLGP
jgi:predicted O-methyltransferase YrrM